PKSALLVVDEVTKKIAGIEIEGYLQDAGFDVDMVSIGEADAETIAEVEEQAKENHTGFLLGIGGGRPIDVAKCASFNIKRHFISVPTAASHDGIVSGRASVLVDGVKKSLEAQSPIAVVADTEILASSPFRMLAAGCGDIISNKTAVLDWKLAQRLRNEEYSSYAATLSEITADLLIEQADQVMPGVEESAWNVVKALTASGVAMSIAGSSRPASGSEHKFSHALDMIAEKPALHGEQCGIGSIMMMYLHGGNWQSIRDALKIIGAPANAEEAGLTREDIIQALVKAHDIKPERYTILGYHGLTKEAAERLAEKTGVI
ncbi:MAG: NAD(P)-dependent glycerol-1-phosphate dehydrogenase, partial [Thermoplasmata archaeon]|nr:NAD(P)-dependent glycerol-1-phosphate dehydrogenase [Thermoplasmata archaeon]